MREKIEVKYINYGIACRIGNKIFINRLLKKYPKLHTAILRHEKAHSSGFVLKDIMMDIEAKEIRELKKEYYSFILNNPSTWTEFLPFWWYEGRFVINPLISFIYLFSLVLTRFIWIRVI